MAQTAIPVRPQSDAHLAPRRRPIDLVHLARQCLGDEGLEREMLALFDETIASCRDRLARSGSAGELAVSLHAIKGAAAGVGAWSIAELAASAEADLLAGRPVEAERIGRIAVAVEEARAFAGATLGRRAPVVPV